MAFISSWRLVDITKVMCLGGECGLRRSGGLNQDYPPTVYSLTEYKDWANYHIEGGRQFPTTDFLVIRADYVDLGEYRALIKFLATLPPFKMIFLWGSKLYLDSLAIALSAANITVTKWGALTPLSPGGDIQLPSFMKEIITHDEDEDPDGDPFGRGDQEE